MIYFVCNITYIDLSFPILLIPSKKVPTPVSTFRKEMNNYEISYVKLL